MKILEPHENKFLIFPVLAFEINSKEIEFYSIILFHQE